VSLPALILASPILTWLIAIPASGAAVVALVPAARTRLLRRTALLFTLLTLACALGAAAMFQWTGPGNDTLVQLRHEIPWLALLATHYAVGVDSLALPLLLLVSSLGVIACLASNGIDKQVKSYYVLLLVALAGSLGALVARDLLLFFALTQLALAPLYFLVGIWGGDQREIAAGKFLLFMLASALLVLLGILGLHSFAQGVSARPFDLTELATNRTMAGLFMPREAIERFFGADTLRPSDGSGVMYAGILFWLFVAGLAIMVGAAGVHTWLIDTLVQAPAPVGMLLCGMVPTLGGYGLFRIVYPIFPHQLTQNWWGLALLGIVTILYGALCALAQKDLKRLIAYAAVSQIGYVLLGLAAVTATAAQGAVFMLLAHGITIALLLAVAGVMEDRAHHCDMDRLRGLATQLPGYGAFAAVGFFAALGLPGGGNFVGQILVLFGTFGAAGINPNESPLFQTVRQNTQFSLMVFAVLATAASLLTAAYLLRAMQRVFLGVPRPEHHHFMPLERYERVVLFLLCTATIVLGVYPTPLLAHLPQFGHSNAQYNEVAN